MQKIHFKVHINAPVDRVWNTMLDDKTYREWTTVFNPGSYYKGSWKKGSKILFIGPDPQTGKEGGLVSRIAENKPYEFVSIEHLGFIDENGVEDTASDKIKEWVGAHENYTFTPKDGGTEVQVELDVADSHKNMFEDMWPKALLKLKKITEE